MCLVTVLTNQIEVPEVEISYLHYLVCKYSFEVDHKCPGPLPSRVPFSRGIQAYIRALFGHIRSLKGVFGGI